jgi:hypothetical protein
MMMAMKKVGETTCVVVVLLFLSSSKISFIPQMDIISFCALFYPHMMMDDARTMMTID